MKASPATVKMIADNMRAYLGARFPLALEQVKANPSKVSDCDLFSLWAQVGNEIRFDDTHPRFDGRARVFPHNFDFPIYPDDTNDTTLKTALRAALKLI
jgi:hypothetical protein